MKKNLKCIVAVLVVFILNCQVTISRRDRSKRNRNRKMKGVYLNQWAVKVIGDDTMADVVARDNGFINKGRVFENVYEFMHRGIPKRKKRASLVKSHHLRRDKRVTFAEQQESKVRVTRSMNFNDKDWPNQWFLHRNEPGYEGQDMNVVPAWKKGYTGKGIVVSVLDDGLEHSHPEIQPNYDPRASYDFNSNDTDPSPKYNWRQDNSFSNRHGTRCAAQIAAVANNSECVVGVAFNAQIGGIRMLDGEITDTIEAGSLSHARDYIDIYSISWGPKDDGKTVDGPGPLTKAALEEGAKSGRDGKGSIVVWASGNGGFADNCNCDGYTNSIYTISVGAAASSGLAPYYLESCASTLVSAYSSGLVEYERSIVTADLNKGCTNKHTGTSASQPLIAGFVALALEANSDLTWRDVQHILVESSTLDKINIVDYQENGAGKKFSHHFGYGIVNGEKLVNLAEKWENVPAQHRCYHPKKIPRYPANRFNKSHPLAFEITTSGCKGSPQYIRYVEHIQLNTTFYHYHRGASEILIQSPSGTSSWVLRERKHDSLGGEFPNWEFLSNHFWGEDPAGTWKVTYFSREPNHIKQGFLQDLSLIIYGTEHKPGETKKDDAYQKHQCHSECIRGCTGPENYHCKACENVFYTDEFNRKNCLAKCPMHMYLDDSTKECLPCHYTCLSCSRENETDCLSCPPFLTLNFGQCIEECPKGKFRDEDPYEKESSVCRHCDKRCTSCYGKATNCSECGPRWMLNGNKCVAKCKGSQWLNEDKCEVCHPTCKTCEGPSSYNCTSCPKKVFKDVEDRFYVQNGQCLTSCPIGTFKDNTINKNCLQCPQNCLQCSNEGRMCEVCRQPYFRIAVGDGKCVEECPDGYYTDDFNRLCEPCDLQCSKCVPGQPKSCISCMDGFFLKDHECVSASECQTRYYVNKTTGRCDFCPSTCSFCESRDFCTTCFLNYYLTPDNKCVEKCPSGTYASDRRTTCGKCAASCLECDGPTSNDCVVCESGKHLHDGRCVSKIAEGYYAEWNGKTSICKPCHHTCTGCNGPKPEDCTTCIKPLDKRENSCMSPCPGQYLSENKCENCNPSCDACYGPNSNQCLKCNGNFSLNIESHTCNKACPRKFYKDLKSFTCKPCHHSCGSCYGPSPNQCLTCPEKLQFHNNSCVWQCPCGWYETFGKLCAPCSPKCKKCLYKHDLCTNCHENEVWHDFKCFDSCGSNMFHDSSNRCYPCHESCNTCGGTAPNECLSCPSGFTLHQNMCIRGCLPGYYMSSKKRMCLPCKKDCIKCGESEDGTLRCLTCIHPTVLTPMGVCEPSCPKGTYQSKLTNKCIKCPGEGCLTCNEKRCFTCDAMYAISNNFCKSICSRRMFLDENTNRCRYCHKLCIACSGPSKHNCVMCREDALVLQNENTKVSCLRKCPSGFYKDRKSCKPCGDPACLKCSSQSTCSNCMEPFFLQQFSCVSNCSSEYLPDENNVCIKCNKLVKNCEVCSRSGCVLCKDGYNEVNGSCIETIGVAFLIRNSSTEFPPLLSTTLSSLPNANRETRSLATKTTEELVPYSLTTEQAPIVEEGTMESSPINPNVNSSLLKEISREKLSITFKKDDPAGDSISLRDTHLKMNAAHILKALKKLENSTTKSEKKVLEVFNIKRRSKRSVDDDTLQSEEKYISFNIFGALIPIISAIAVVALLIIVWQNRTFVISRFKRRRPMTKHMVGIHPTNFH